MVNGTIDRGIISSCIDIVPCYVFRSYHRVGKIGDNHGSKGLVSLVRSCRQLFRIYRLNLAVGIVWFWRTSRSLIYANACTSMPYSSALYESDKAHKLQQLASMSCTLKFKPFPPFLPIADSEPICIGMNGEFLKSHFRQWQKPRLTWYWSFWLIAHPLSVQDA